MDKIQLRLVLIIDPVQTRELEKKHYELTDHLGNVRAVLGDRKMTTTPGAGNYYADVEAYTHQYPFGMPQPGRTYDGSSLAYRYGFNGMETNPEVKGEYGNHYTTYFRQYDPRVGRWWSNDPVVHEWESPYVAMANNPVLFSDPLGNDPPCEGCKIVDPDIRTSGDGKSIYGPMYEDTDGNTFLRIQNVATGIIWYEKGVTVKGTTLLEVARKAFDFATYPLSPEIPLNPPQKSLNEWIEKGKDLVNSARGVGSEIDPNSWFGRVRIGATARLEQYLTLDPELIADKLEELKSASYLLLLLYRSQMGDITAQIQLGQLTAQGIENMVEMEPEEFGKFLIDLAIDLLLGAKAASLSKKLAKKIGKIDDAVLVAKAARTGFTSAENQIIDEVLDFYNSSEFQVIRKAHAEKKTVTVTFNGIEVQYQHDFVYAQAFNNGNKGWTMGPNAFSSELELKKTLLHERYRNHFDSRANFNQEQGSSQTTNAFNFAEKAANHIQ